MAVGEGELAIQKTIDPQHASEQQLIVEELPMHRRGEARHGPGDHVINRVRQDAVALCPERARLFGDDHRPSEDGRVRIASNAAHVVEPAFAVTWAPPIHAGCFWKRGVFGRWKFICP